MPRRKSTASAVEGDEPGSGEEDVSMSHASAGKQPEADTGANVEDYLLPRSLTQRLAKSSLPPQTAIHKDALLAISKAATVFVSYLSSNANDETTKKTIAPQNVLDALSEIEFDSFRPRLERELAAYTDAAAQKRKAKKGGTGDGDGKDSSAGGPSGKAVSGGAAEQRQEEEEEEEEEEEPDAKRVKRSSGLEPEVATGQAKQPAASSSATKDAQAGDDGDETEELEEDEQVEEEGEEEEEDEEEQDEDEDEAGEQDKDADATQPDDELEAQDSDTARRRKNPDLDSDMDSESDD